MKKSFKINELGRSMVEILGVLAIIGVLSFGGIQGYRLAMELYQANEISNTVNMVNRDIWYNYQDVDKILPDTFPEWENVKPAGHQMNIRPYAKSNTFDVVIKGVSENICKRLIPMLSIGPEIIWIETEPKMYYTGDDSICERDNTMDMVFTTSLERYGSEVDTGKGVKDEHGNDLTFCIEDSDCTGKCDEGVCNKETRRCVLKCRGATPYCSTSGEAGKECVSCDKNTHCEQNQVCDESTQNNQCLDVSEMCEPGTFRSKNGACISCAYGGNIVVENKPYSTQNIQDNISGVEMCQSCETYGHKRNLEQLKSETGETIYYCSKTCTRGVSVQVPGKGCVLCNEYPETADYAILNDTQSKEQCEACGLKVWTAWGTFCGKQKCPVGQYKLVNGECRDCTNVWPDALVSKSGCEDACPGLRFADSIDCNAICQQPKNVSEEESIRICKEEGPLSPNCKRSFNANNGSRIACYTCSGGGNRISITNVPQQYKDLCEKCGRVLTSDGYCEIPSCLQPSNSESLISICQEAGPTSPNCTRKFRGSNGKCYDCSYNEKVSLSGLTKAEQDLCTQCGRYILGQTCILELPSCKNEQDEAGNNKSDNQFMGYDSNCYSCSTEKSVKIENTPEAKAMCVNNCSGVTGTISNVSFSGRQVVVDSAGTVSCIPVCPSGYFNAADTNKAVNECISCSDEDNSHTAMHLGSGVTTYSNELQNICQKCSNRIVFKNVGRCVVDVCPSGSVHGAYGECVSCDALTQNITRYAYNGGISTTIFKKECEDCGNRIMFGDNCVKIERGVSGICNDYDNGDFEGYSEGNGKLYRDSTGICRSCSDQKNSYTSNITQCKSCNSRRMVGSQCVFGLCEQENAFVAFDGSCKSCSAVSTQIDMNQEAKDYCIACRRDIMTVGKSDNQNRYCVEQCGMGITYLTKGDSICKSCDVGGNNEIGKEPIYSNYCEACNRVAYERDGIVKCSQQAVLGESFVYGDGFVTSCSNSQSLEIPNTDKAIELCNMCSVTKRQAVQKSDNKMYCDLLT